MYQVLYRSFRPETFDSILGQEHIVRILQNQLATDAAGHAYLFCGTRGTGKTTTARLLAKGVNCLAEVGQRPCGECSNCLSIKNGTFMDVVEIDAASNNGVENIRELRESVKYPPAVGRCKVYIIDEVHMLSTGAFNALLKTLEEPPENVMFILATTEVQKLPATILSRCLRLDFHRVPERQLKAGMKSICETLGVEITDQALGLIATNADGSVRDGLSILDQCITAGSNQVSRELVLSVLGTAGEEIFTEITEHVVLRRVEDALLLLNQALEDGKDVKQFMKDWVGHFRNLLMTKFIKNPEDVLNMSSENVERIRVQSSSLPLAVINNCVLELSRTLAEAKWTSQPRILLELAIVKLAESGGEGGAPDSERGFSGGSHSSNSRISDGQSSRSGVSSGFSGGNSSGTFFSEDRSGQQSGSGTQAGPGVASETAAFGSGDESSIGSSESPNAATDLPNGSSAAISVTGTDSGDSILSEHELADLWHKVLQDGAAVKGSFNMLRSGTRLRRVSEHSFTVEVSNDMMKRYASDNHQDLEALMEKHTGKTLRLECSAANEGPAAAGGGPVNPEKMAEDVGKRLGIHVGIR